MNKMLVLAGLVLCAWPAVAERMAIKGAVAYTEPLRYDYDGDGKRDRVQFWLEFDGLSAVGTPGQSGYEPASGTVRYFLQDVDDGRKITKWRHGLDMEGAPKDVPMPMSDIEFDGRTVRFEAYGMRWTVIDGGDGYASDRITVNDGFRTSDVKKLYAGDLWVGPVK